MSAEYYERPMYYMGRMGYALKHGHGLYAARGARTLLGASLGIALIVAAGAVLIVGAAGLAVAGKKSKE
ncbi:hypothetical protein ACFL3G_13255 [Planctomycetota bacterium]